MIRLGRAWDRGYACYWRTVDRQITAQNRVLVGLAPGPADAADGAQSASAVSPSERARLMQRYREYHRTGDPEINLDEDGEGDEEEVQDDEEEEGGEEVGVGGTPGCPLDVGRVVSGCPPRVRRIRGGVRRCPPRAATGRWSADIG